MNKYISLNSIINKLNLYWHKHGCILLQPLDSEVGAATFHPKTFFSAIDKKPFKAAYTQISRRPFDLKYHDNSNKSNIFHQYQVIIKPSVQNIQDLYLQSLKQIGINIYKNDIRFIEDNWKSPSLGASGVGWEVRLNGMEITQFTYFQKMGSINCYPVMIEIAYGIERLALHIQKIYNINEILFDNISILENIKYGALFNTYEKEYTSYTIEFLTIEELKNEFLKIENKINTLLKKNLILIAYDFLVKLSNLFNFIDTKIPNDIIRQEYIFKIKNLAKKIAQNFKNEK